MHHARSLLGRCRHRAAVLVAVALSLAVPGVAAGTIHTANYLRTDLAGSPARGAPGPR